MVCRVADNPALEMLRSDLGLERFCHSQRVDCIHRLPRAVNSSYYGISGAFMGYCQALFHHNGDHENHTIRMAEMLSSANLPWARSHELFLGHKGSLTTQDFVEAAARPLADLGRVPILITGIDAGDTDLVSEIFSSDVGVVEGETVLVRLVVGNSASGDAASRLVHSLVDQARLTGRMPRWWPLFQASNEIAVWRQLIHKLGSNWKYTNIAVNPFTSPAVVELLNAQIMVSQLVVPGPTDIDLDGHVQISKDMSIYGAGPGATYNIRATVNDLAQLPSWPTCIFLGPTQADWSDGQNLQRLRVAVDAFMAEAKCIWKGNGLARYAPLWDMAA